ncbi:hypothetical protein [Streptomyces huiliensis]|uniref:hypothetical protein n=1 Tax=Streptomyces huiliensis TaxID=2876027 RepID=UPI001CC11A6E|nr:hypothetical protein [Streptomyces huiliensis]MBZ4321407.1 hypothetical protein [Streptomyces huiliensis]
MSLSVDVFLVDEDGAVHLLDVPEGCSDLAGFEQWRTTVWGSEAVRASGARFLPVLADGDLRVDAGQVRAFRRECAALRENLEEVLAGLRPLRTVDELRDQLSARLANIEDAAWRAEEAGGGVLIW